MITKVHPHKVAKAAGTHGYVLVTHCQLCGSQMLSPVLTLGQLPAVNLLLPMGLRRSSRTFPTDLLYCEECSLVQLGAVVDPAILFPPEYPYTSGTTKLLKDNFAELFSESHSILGLGEKDLVVDIGSNDGTLLANFQKGGCKVLGIEPTNVAAIAQERGIPTLQAPFDRISAFGVAKVVTAANCFAHMEDLHGVTSRIVDWLTPDGVFISESHYLPALIETLQYDTIYHEHLRYYTLRTLQLLLEIHGLQVFHAKRIPSHGGSIRVYAARKGVYRVRDTVAKMLAAEPPGPAIKRQLIALGGLAIDARGELWGWRQGEARDKQVFGVGAPSRASTLLTFCGFDVEELACVCEVEGSLKIGFAMPGTSIPIVEESCLFGDNQPDYALILSWQIADELMAKLRKKGFKGKFVVPLPEVKVIE